MKKDKLHYSCRKLDSYGRKKPFRFVISEREALASQLQYFEKFIRFDYISIDLV